MIIAGEDYLAHYGILRKSGRYPWGSGNSQAARNRSFLDITDKMVKDGMSPTDVAKGFGMTTTEFRALRSIASNQQKQDKIGQAEKLAATGMSNRAIGVEMGGLNESSVRSLLAAGKKEDLDSLQNIAAMLKKNVDEKTYLDVGAGVENQLSISETKLKTALEVLKESGYEVIPVQVPQLGTQNKTTIKVLTPPGTTYLDVKLNRDQIRQISQFSDDGGRTLLNIQPPLNVDPKRIKVLYNEEGGGDLDGVIYVRRGVDDVSIGAAQYAQVRIAVGGTHYLKGMAVYKDGLPNGVDLVFNTSKSSTGNKLDAMKPLKRDKDGNIEGDNPFGSTIRQILDVGPDGKERNTSAMNMVGMKEGSGEEGGWDTWKKSLPTQFLSKQSPKLAQQQLDMTYDRKKQELAEIKALTNPTVRKKLLEIYANSADSSAVHLQAAALPRQATRVIMPVNSLKSNEVYAPNFIPGERVVLVRYPHGGTFEIPELIVNNSNRAAQRLLGKEAQDAVGINAKVAKRLSGADFDGDTVVVIPNNSGRIKSTSALKELNKFDPQRLYKGYEGMKVMDKQAKGTQMGLVSNLITDMTIKGASPSELARAVKHSMVVIDAEKHGLDYKRSARDQGIRQLSIKYQEGRAQGGSSTLISRAKSPKKVDDYKLRSAKDDGPIDPKTGKLVYRDKPESYVTRDGRTIVKRRGSTKLAETDDARTLLSKGGGQKIEVIYAAHSNRMKALANESRKEVAAFKPPLISKSAKKIYAAEVKSLGAKLNRVRRNKPLERQAQVFANATLAQKRAANPNLDGDELKKIRFQALARARKRTGAAKFDIVPTASEWAAIQAGAVSNSQLKQILDSADLEAVKRLATPRTRLLMTSSKTARARAMAASGYTQGEIAEALGVSLATLRTTLNE